MSRTVVVAVCGLVALVLFAGVAAAVSSGGYDPAKQGAASGPGSKPCPKNEVANDFQGAYPQCHNFVVGVDSSSDPQHYHRYVQAGTLEEAQNENVHAADYRVDSNGDGSGLVVSGGADTNYQPFTPDSCGVFDAPFFAIDHVLLLLGQTDHACSLTPTGPPQTPPTVAAPTFQTGDPKADGLAALVSQGASIYIGSDDNLDTGEHDGVDGKNGSAYSANGPSDGGAVVVNWVPGGRDPSLSNPVPVANAHGGECADGQCVVAHTSREDVYNGGAKGSRPVYDYRGKHWDPAGCSSGSARDETTACDDPNTPQHENISTYRHEEKQHVYADPGVTVFEDPDAQGSPIGPYPLPAVYAGTCGVTAGGGAMPAPDSPITSGSGQYDRQARVDTGCSRG